MPSRDPRIARLTAQIAAHERWAKCEDPKAATAPARKAFLTDRFERQVDPDGTLDPAERARRADSARRAWYTRLQLKSAQARRARRLADQLAAEVEAGLADGGAA